MEERSVSNELLQIFDKPGAKAHIWQYFGVADANERNSAAVCRLCKEIVPRNGGTTSCIWSHLKVHHASEYSALRPKHPSSDTAVSTFKLAKIDDHEQKNEEQTSEKFDGKLYSTTSDKWKDLTDCVTNCIARAYLSVDVIEKDQFKQMLQKFDPKYQLPESSYFTQVALPRLHSHFKMLIADELKDISFVAVSVDILDGASESVYLNIACHYVTVEWEMRSRTLETVYLPRAADGSIKPDIRSTIEEVLHAWFIADKVVTITTNGNIFEKYDFPWPTILCFGDAVLNKKISTVIRSDSVVQRVSDVADSVFFAFSHGRAKQHLEEAQSQLSLPKHQLKVESNAWWRSLYLSFERLLEQKRAIEVVLRDNKYFQECARVLREFEVIDDVCGVLKPLCDVTDALLGEKYVSLSTVLPLLKLLDGLLAQDDADGDVAAKLKRNLRDSLKFCFGEVRQFLHKATLLDPRYKDSVPTEELPQVKRLLLNEALKTNSFITNVHEKAENNGESVEPPLKKKPTLAKLLSNMRGNGNNPTTTANIPISKKITKEIDSYLNETIVYAEADPLEWWRNRQTSYRYLSQLARKYLCCCATCCLSEKLFRSKGGHVGISPSICQFPDGVNILTFLSHNL